MMRNDAVDGIERSVHRRFRSNGITARLAF